jgi:hypothetical protein
LRVVAKLAAPLAGDPPMLDSLLAYVASRRHGKSGPPGYKVDRSRPCPGTDHLPIAIPRRDAGGWRVPLCSSPILPEPGTDTVEYVCKRLAVEHAALCEPTSRVQVNTTGGPFKSYRLPLRVRRVACVVWLCQGDRRELLKLLKAVTAVGKKVADGYGRVLAWEIDRMGDPPHDLWPWWCDSDIGPVLMRPLPIGSYLPPSLVGSRRDFGSVTDPYWHPDRYCERVIPC